MDWYVEKKKLSVLSESSPTYRTISLFTSVVAGITKSVMPSILSEVLLAFGSEQIAYTLYLYFDCADHSTKVWLSKEIDGTKNSTLPIPFVTASAIFRAVKVLPVPQAIISLPRSACLKPLITALTASIWWGRSFFFEQTFISSILSRVKLSQSIPESFRSWRRIRVTGGNCPIIVVSALDDHLSVVDTIIRSENLCITPST